MHTLGIRQLPAVPVGSTPAVGALSTCVGPDTTEVAFGGSSAADSLNGCRFQRPKEFNLFEAANDPDQFVMPLVSDPRPGLDTSHKMLHLSANRRRLSRGICGDDIVFGFELRLGLDWSEGKLFTTKGLLFIDNWRANAYSGDASSGCTQRSISQRGSL